MHRSLSPDSSDIINFSGRFPDLVPEDMSSHCRNNSDFKNYPQNKDLTVAGTVPESHRIPSNAVRVPYRHHLNRLQKYKNFSNIVIPLAEIFTDS